METLFCIGCQTTKLTIEFDELPESPRGYRYDCMKCVSSGNDRTNRYWMELYDKHKTVCSFCGVPRKLIADDKCKRCLKESGFKLCKRCNIKKLALIDFYPKKGECIECSADKAAELRYKQCKHCKTWRKTERCRCSLSRHTRCTRCQQDETAVAFTQAKRVCDSCIQSYETQPENVEQKRRAALSIRDKARDTQVRRYGLKIEDVQQMTVNQEGKCSICQGQPAKNRALCVDHDHATGKVRALLCHNCNLGLGNFKDSPELLQKAIDYLKQHATSSRTSS